MSSIDPLVTWNEEHGSEAASPGMGPRPRTRVAVVTCMDVRISPARVLGIDAGDAHVLRNAGGIVTEDVIRSLVVSQIALGTEAVMVIGHTRCGMEGLDPDRFAAEVEAGRGGRPDFALGAFVDLDIHVRRSVERLRAEPLLAGEVRGFVFDVDTGRLREV